MNALHVLDTFQLDDKVVLGEDVNSVSTIEPNILVSYQSTQLELKGDSVATQLMGHALFVRRFEHSRAEVPVDFDGTIDDTIRKLLELPLRALRVLRGNCFSASCL